VSDLADALIDDILRDFPGHRSGTRPVHAPGIVATGWFQATDVARDYTKGEHFQGDRAPVTVRFSNGTGLSTEPDSKPAVRGMAVKFHLGKGNLDATGIWRSERETDMVCMTLPVFFTETADRFREFTVAAIPKPPTNPSWRQRLLDRLVLRDPPPRKPPGSPPSGDQGILAFASGYRPACPAVVAYRGMIVPESYTACSYHAVHAFKLSAADGTVRWVRFHWEPVGGVRPAEEGTTGDFLFEELEDRVDDDRTEFVLRMQIAEQGDDTTDPTTAWPRRRRRVVMGHLRLDAMVVNQVDGGERLSFDPTSLTPGIAVSDDRILEARGLVYGRSVARRAAALDEQAHMAPSTPDMT
jgi:catalase